MYILSKLAEVVTCCKQVHGLNLGWDISWPD